MSAVLQTVVVFVLTSYFPITAGQELGRVATPPRGDAPLQFAATSFSDTSLRVLLVNVSGREIKQVTMGIVLEDARTDGKSVVASVTRTGMPCEASVPPGGFVVLKETNIGFDTASSDLRDKGITKTGAVIGITHVRFGDGTEWTYPLADRGRFDEQVDESVKAKVESLVKTTFPDRNNLSAALFGNQTAKVSTCGK